MDRKFLDVRPAHRFLKQTHDHGETTMLAYVIELRTPAQPPAYVVAQAETRDGARALIEAHLGHDDANDDVVIVAVHPLQ